MSDPRGVDDPADLRALAGYCAALVAAVDEHLGQWVERVVAERWRQGTGESPPAGVAEAARQAGRAAVAEVVPRLRDLLERDVEAQPTNPLAVIRGAVPHPTSVLAEAGLPPVERDADARRLFPDDLYDLTPGAFGDIHPAVHEPGIVWGAAKAHVILKRHRHG